MAAVNPVHVENDELLRESELEDAGPMLLPLFERGAPLGVKADDVERLFCAAPFRPGHSSRLRQHRFDDLACVLHGLRRGDKDERLRQVRGELRSL